MGVVFVFDARSLEPFNVADALQIVGRDRETGIERTIYIPRPDPSAISQPERANEGPRSLIPMRIDLYIHESGDSNLFRSLHTKVDTIMATQAEQAAKLRALATQLGKSKAEIISAVDKLKEALEDGGSTPEVDDATAALETAVQGLDDLNPDEDAAPL